MYANLSASSLTLVGHGGPWCRANLPQSANFRGVDMCEQVKYEHHRYMHTHWGTRLVLLRTWARAPRALRARTITPL